MTAVAPRRTAKAQPKRRVVGEVRHPKTSAKRNTKAEVGNVTLMIGNWGERSTKTSCQNREVHDRQVMGSPAQIIVIFEATAAVANMLEGEPEHVEDKPQLQRTGPAPVGNVEMRDWHEHHVMTGADPKTTVLMAARKNNCNGIMVLCYEPWFDSSFKQSQKKKIATTKVMVCTFDWKQNIGDLGNKVNVMGVHGHYHTMNMNISTEEYEKWWDKIKQYID